MRYDLDAGRRPRRHEMSTPTPERDTIVTAETLRSHAAQLCPCSAPQCGNLHDRSRRNLQAAAKRIEYLESRVEWREDQLRRMVATFSEFPAVVQDLNKDLLRVNNNINCVLDICNDLERTSKEEQP